MPEFIPFRFVVSLYSSETGGDLLCRGEFSEVTGFEATMSAKTMKEGGRNWGDVQLAGAATFPAIVLKRGITEMRDLHSWFDVTTRQANYGYRMNGIIEVYDQARHDNSSANNNESSVKPILKWQIDQAMATKFKGPDLSSTSSQVAIEELHLVHEGLHLVDDEEQQENANG